MWPLKNFLRFRIDVATPHRQVPQPITLRAAAVTAEALVNLLGWPTVIDDALASSIRQHRSGKCCICFFPSGHVSLNRCPEIPVTRTSRSASMRW